MSYSEQITNEFEKYWASHYDEHDPNSPAAKLIKDIARHSFVSGWLAGEKQS